MMTRQELIFAAKIARTYPVGMGDHWGYGPLEIAWAAEDAAAMIEVEPWLIRYG